MDTPLIPEADDPDLQRALASPPTLEIALGLWRRGLSVIPIPRPRAGVPTGQPGDGKVPSLSWKPFQNRLATEDEIRACLRRR